MTTTINGKISQFQSIANQLTTESVDVTFSLSGQDYSLISKEGLLAFYKADRLAYIFDTAKSALYNGSFNNIKQSTSKGVGYYYKSENSTHQVIGNRFYCILSTDKLKSKNIYIFNPNAPDLCKIKCLLGPLKEPHFVGNHLIEFGSGCNQDIGFGFTGKAIIYVYDLTTMKENNYEQDFSKKTTFMLSGISGFLACTIDKNEKTILTRHNSESYAIPFTDENYKGSPVITVSKG